LSTISIIAAGKLKKGPVEALARTYADRIRWTVHIREVEAKHNNPAHQNARENEKLLQTLPRDAYVMALDGRGKTLSSIEFAKKIRALHDEARPHIAFVIGGSEGLSDDIRRRADMLLSFGAQTWPHMLARVMLLEQIYRAQQIIAGHPYHKE
jgi:23S rRNA (pseudouridine1915-N3)-methyltransferase